MNPLYASATDSDLFQLLKEEDVAAFEAIYDRYFIRLLNIAYKRMENKEDALEVVQDVFIRLYAKRAQIENTDYLFAYLQTLLKHGMIDRFRQHLVQQKQYAAIKEQVQTHTVHAADQQIDSKKLEEKIHYIINSLPEKCKEAFILSRMQYLSHQAIATKMSISVSTVEKHIVKALQQLRKQLKETNV
ncbi:RNA polymerase sigma-70 factor (ECF subfamily) [Chitinophaga niastensis]|uniref:RNA polymerase sigma-70 factor (ECF subfamily) n=1 Tax=Chitinophaga niastensis TaxID=536980 RepID=A0A2P8HPZ0_CHINA|nr:RNA polymerase sigma-70 factor [Chitinophaga niastensis]PSL48310.1 RNA polymerase sigma-70 factor (ECF subfamily) [Chitinophaga niastensis]